MRDNILEETIKDLTVNTDDQTNSGTINKSPEDEYFTQTAGTSESASGTNGATLDEELSNSDDEKELQELLAKQKLLERMEEENIKKEIEQHFENARNNLNIFLTWAEEIISKVALNDLYKEFTTQFSDTYRSELYENICEFFSDESYVSDDILFFWKCLVVSLISRSRKYKYCLDKNSDNTQIELNYESRETNFKLVKEKHIFRCFISGEAICYFKENGTDYYVS